jgi:dye decolorizing peroxidase
LASESRGVTRRGLLGGLALGAGGLAVGGAAGYATAAEPPTDPTALGATTEDCFGAHQAGIDTARQANATFVSLDLRDGVNREALVRLMSLLTDDIVRLTQGRAALADPLPELADVPARLTVTVGFGRGFLRAAGREDQTPSWLAAGLPKFSIDELQPAWSGGDLLLQVAAEDPLTVSHAVRVLLTDARPFATVRWMQSGFHRPANTSPASATGRNLMGQVDGTINPEPGSEDFDRVVWIGSDKTPEWLRGGTGIVIRRIAMDLKTWGGMDQMAKEEAIGRRLSDGAPLTGGDEFTAPDFEAVDANGFEVIPPTSHIRLAHGQASNDRILRRPYNYDDGLDSDGDPETGLLFVAYMADAMEQFVPIQTRLAEADVLNIWTTPIGSALFAIPPGFSEGEYVGQTLLG